MRVGPVGSYPVFWNPYIQRTRTPGRKRLERFQAPEFKSGVSRVTANEIIPPGKTGDKKIETEEDTRKLDKDRWINELYDQKISYGNCIVQIQSLGYTPIESKEVVDEAIHHSERSTDWAISNSTYGKIGEHSIILATCVELAEVFLNHIEENNNVSISPVVKTGLGVVKEAGVASRGYFQYEKIYGGRNDDDRARNNYEASEYGNKISGSFSNLAYIFETNINPVSLVALGILGGKTQKSLRPLLSLSTSLWWRIRMLAEINQEFGTDLITYLINKPLALLQVESSINQLKEIKDNGNLNYDYVQKRLLETLELDPKKDKLNDIFPELCKLLKTLFNKDKTLARHASENLGKFFGPIFGFYGFLAHSIGVPVKSILTWLEKESKFINALVHSGVASQQLLYLFRLMLPEQFDNQANSNGLQKEREHSFYAGAATCLANVISTGIQFINPENKYLKLGKDITEVVAERGVNYYFSKRRKLLGKKHRLDNPELYNIDGTVKIISDKVRIEDEK